MEKQKNNNTLLVVKNNSLQEVKNRMLPKAMDGAKRIGKILGYSGVALASIVAVSVGSLPVAAIGTVAGIRAGYGAILNTLYKTEPGLMFVSQKKTLKGEIEIFQASVIDATLKMKGYTNGEKGGMMALQALVGFSRYKKNLEGSDYEVGENGEKIYTQRISTVTHGINIKNFQMLETLGYIKIDSMDNRHSQNLVGRILGREPKEKQSLLILEKLGFKNFGDLREIAKAAVTGDKDTLTKMKKTTTRITFRLTDKPIDFEELYSKYSDLGQVEDRDERVALRRMAGIFNHERGILTTKNLDIVKDRYGRDILKYNVKESFGMRMQKRLKQGQQETQNLKDRIREEVDIAEALKRSQEQREQQTQKTQKIETR